MRAMTKPARNHRAWQPHSNKQHLVFGAGGTRAFLNGAGAMFACHLAGSYDWESIGGVSGGSIPALLTAGGVHPREIVRHAVSTDFTDLLEQHDTFSNMLKQRFLRRRSAGRLLRHGIVRSAGLGAYLESVVPEWPDKFWTMAVAGKRILLFTKNGVFVYRKGRALRQITKEPAPVSLAIRASCAVPGIIEAVEFEGHVLFDGALSTYGACPTEMAITHFGAEADDIVAVDLVRRSGNRRDRFVEMLARALSGTLRQRPRLPFVTDAGMIVRTDMETFNSLDFDITTELKQRAVLAGFRTTCQELWLSGKMNEHQYNDALAHSETWELFEELLAASEVVHQDVPTPDVEPKQRRRWYYLWLR
jgi:predicted acylesterase/phospholipase RssA